MDKESSEKSSPLLQVVEAAMLLAYEAGKWEGQVELEEHYDRSQYAQAFMESIVSRKTAMPMKEASNGRTVTINLRSDQWRDGVRHSSKQYLYKALSIVAEQLQLTKQP